MTKVALHFSHKTLRYFKRWTNKSYGVFASLGVMVKICVMSFAYLIIVRPGLVSAQTDSLKIGIDAEIEEVVVSDELRAVTFSELSGAVMVVKSSDIQELPVSTINDLLEHFSSVDIRQRGGHGVQADLLIRGGSFDQVLILLNGVNITDPQTGHHNLNIPIDLKSIQRIEILQGASVLKYGLGSFSGAINFITSPNGKTFVDLSTTVGEHGLSKQFSNVAVSNKIGEFTFSASSSKSDGFMENTDFSITNLYAHGKLHLSKGNLSFQAGAHDKGFGAQSFYTPLYPNQYEQNRSYITSLSYNYRLGNFSITPTTYYRLHTDRFELFRNNPPEWYGNHNHHKTSVLGMNLSFVTLFSNAKLEVGADVRSEDIVSNVLGQQLANNYLVSGYQNVYYTKGASRLTSSVFSDYTHYFDIFSASAGLQLVSNNRFGVFWNYGADFSTNLFNSFRAYLSFHKSIRFPTFTDLYYNGPTNIGNPNLQPEEAKTIEVGIKSSRKYFKINASAFYRSGTDIIDWVKSSVDEKWTTANYTKLATTGFESTVELNISEILPQIRKMYMSYTYVNSSKKKDLLLSYYTMDYLRNKLSGGVQHKIYKNLNASWHVLWQDRAGSYTDFSTNAQKEYSPFVTVNFSLSLKIGRITIFSEVDNLFNKKFFDLGNVPQPGRWVTGSLNFQID